MANISIRPLLIVVVVNLYRKTLKLKILISYIECKVYYTNIQYFSVMTAACWARTLAGRASTSTSSFTAAPELTSAERRPRSSRAWRESRSVSSTFHSKLKTVHQLIFFKRNANTDDLFFITTREKIFCKITEQL